MNTIRSAIIGVLRIAAMVSLCFATISAYAQSSNGTEEFPSILPIPNYGADIFARPTLTGDWGGARTSLAEFGWQFEVDATGFYQGIFDGGLDETSEASAVLDYRLFFDTGQAGLWPGGLLELHAETYAGDAINASDGALLPANWGFATSAPAGDGTYLSHFTYTQFFSERFGIQFGRINTAVGDATAYTHGSNGVAVGREKFMNAAFNLNPVTYLASPYSPYGANFLYRAGDEMQHLISFSVWDADTESVEDYDLDTLFEGQTSIAAGGRFETNFFGKVGHQSINFIYGFGDYNSLDQRFIDIIGPNPMPVTEDGTWAVFYNFDQALVTNPFNPDVNWGVFGRIGFADDKTNIFSAFYSIGFGGNGLIPSRPQDTFGIAYYYADISDRLGLDFLIDGSEQGVEMFYKYQVLPSFSITGDLQILDGARANTDTAIVGALRARFSF